MSEARTDARDQTAGCRSGDGGRCARLRRSASLAQGWGGDRGTEICRTGVCRRGKIQGHRRQDEVAGVIQTEGAMPGQYSLVLAGVACRRRCRPDLHAGGGADLGPWHRLLSRCRQRLRNSGRKRHQQDRKKRDPCRETTAVTGKLHRLCRSPVNASSGPCRPLRPCRRCLPAALPRP